MPRIKCVVIWWLEKSSLTKNINTFFKGKKIMKKLVLTLSFVLALVSISFAEDLKLSDNLSKTIQIEIEKEIVSKCKSLEKDAESLKKEDECLSKIKSSELVFEVFSDTASVLENCGEKNIEEFLKKFEEFLFFPPKQEEKEEIVELVSDALDILDSFSGDTNETVALEKIEKYTKKLQAPDEKALTIEERKKQIEEELKKLKQECFKKFNATLETVVKAKVSEKLK